MNMKPNSLGMTVLSCATLLSWLYFAIDLSVEGFILSSLLFALIFASAWYEERLRTAQLTRFALINSQYGAMNPQDCISANVEQLQLIREVDRRRAEYIPQETLDKMTEDAILDDLMGSLRVRLRKTVRQANFWMKPDVDSVHQLEIGVTDIKLTKFVRGS